MKIEEFIWVFNETELSSGIDGPFSLDYHLPSARLGVAPGRLVGSRIWLVVKRGERFFLYAFISPSSLEMYQEGKYQGDFLLRTEPLSSVRLLPRKESRDAWRLESENMAEGVHECSEAMLCIFLEKINKNQRVGFAPPSRLILEQIPRTPFRDFERAVPDQLMATLRTIAFGDAARSPSMPNSVSALGGFTMAVLNSTHPFFSRDAVADLVASLDPLAGTTKTATLRSPIDALKALAALPPMIDTSLEEIDMDKIAPRKYVASHEGPSLEWLDKVNDAEQSHERILKELASYLKDHGYRIYRTRSFDLFAEKFGEGFLWEIKSANCTNSVSQGEKGIVQLLRYSMALSETKFTNTKYLLLIEDSGQRAVHEYLSAMGSRTGAEVWLYNESKPWPNRVSNLAAQNITTL